MNWLLLAQTVDPEKAIGWADTLAQAGVAVICLVIAGLALWALWVEKKKNTSLELAYRKDLADRAEQAKADAEKRLLEAKKEARERAEVVDKLMRERMAVEKESDATLAHAVHMIEAATKVMERLERKLEA